MVSAWIHQASRAAAEAKVRLALGWIDGDYNVDAILTRVDEYAPAWPTLPPAAFAHDATPWGDHVDAVAFWQVARQCADTRAAFQEANVMQTEATGERDARSHARD